MKPFVWNFCRKFHMQKVFPRYGFFHDFEEWKVPWKPFHTVHMNKACRQYGTACACDRIVEK